MGLITNVIILGLFVLWFFIRPWGSVGLLLFMCFFLFMYLTTRLQCRKIINHFRDEIMHYFSYDEGDFKFIYDNAYYYVFPFASRVFSSTSSFIAIGCIVFGFVSILIADWVSVGICVFFYIFSSILASKLNKPFFLYDSVRKEPTKSILVEKKLDKYAEFFINEWPNIIKKSKESGHNI